MMVAAEGNAPSPIADYEPGVSLSEAAGGLTVGERSFYYPVG